MIGRITKLFGSKKLKILLYTDSRGRNIPNSKIKHLAREYDYKHYHTLLIEKYNVEAYLMPAKWTTTLDFIEMLENKDTNKYDIVILHTGIVDFSPRHQRSILEIIYPQKKMIFDKVFGENKIRKYINSDLGVEYETDKTANLYSYEMAIENLLPLLKQIPNLIWIGGNPILTDWRGNYWKDRPGNIKIVEEYFNLFEKELPNTISLMNWQREDVMENTFDNIHLNKKGSDLVFNMLESEINKLIDMK